MANRFCVALKVSKAETNELGTSGRPRSRQQNSQFRRNRGFRTHLVTAIEQTIWYVIRSEPRNVGPLGREYPIRKVGFDQPQKKLIWDSLLQQTDCLPAA